jgi:hypothetical protein
MLASSAELLAPMPGLSCSTTSFSRASGVVGENTQGVGLIWARVRRVEGGG